jgi:hypothetical protein
VLPHKSRRSRSKIAAVETSVFVIKLSLAFAPNPPYNRSTVKTEAPEAVVCAVREQLFSDYRRRLSLLVQMGMEASNQSEFYLACVATRNQLEKHEREHGYFTDAGLVGHDPK